MKALTICQPYAELICLPETDHRHKRVENRSWSTSFRGALAIHAGKSQDWLTLDPLEKMDADYEIPLDHMTFGGFVAVATLLDCLNIEAIQKGKHDQQYPWLREHQHASGPWCWVLGNVRRLYIPIPYSGSQGIWEVDERLIDSVASLYPGWHIREYKHSTCSKCAAALLVGLIVLEDRTIKWRNFDAQPIEHNGRRLYRRHSCKV